MVISTKQYVQM